ncbi:D-TA family PLP-dependent enzyme [Lentibacillus sp. N15]|uniref:D-TA family PLP-dependent enzyme n=1 Tax=Lentibacillus songyuanensis TaxID=3136161 RepID=UPI0031BA4840
MKVNDIDTPALLIDKGKMMKNLQDMQAYANEQQVALRPHTKTHKMPNLARMQEELGATGITVAKIGEAEVMEEYGLTDIFIANEIVGETKLNRIKKLAETINISFAIDCVEHIQEIERVFQDAPKKAQVLIEIEVGEGRSGVIERDDFKMVMIALKEARFIQFKGIFSHDGHTYKANDHHECRQLFEEAVNRTLSFAEIAEEMGMKAEVISIGSTPPFMLQLPIPKGVTEIRPGTYVFMDASQGNVIGSLERCAATILTSVISKPTWERVITDVGAKGITSQTRSTGLTKTKGLGHIMEYGGVTISDVFDEHAIIYDARFRGQVTIGEKVRIIPNHICPVVNLHEKAYLISGDEVTEEIPVSCRGKSQ